MTARWQAPQPPQLEAHASTDGSFRDLVLKITGADAGESYTFRDVAVGEVWIAGGQSNMEFPLEYDAEAKTVIAKAKDPDIRFYDCPKIKFERQEQEDDTEQVRLLAPLYNQPTLFSAVGFYFARKINERYHVPVGIVGCNWSGTTASAWLDESYLAADEKLAIYFRVLRPAFKNWTWRSTWRRRRRGGRA